MKEKKVLICGAGSIGIFLGAKIHLKNHEVHLFGRRKLKEAGNEVFINDERFKIMQSLFSLPKNEEYDFVFITSKLYDLDKIVKLIRKSNVKGKIFAGIQNGLIDNSKYKKLLHNKKLVPICIFGGFRIEKNKLISKPTSIGWLTEYSRNGKKVSKFISSCGVKCKPEKEFEFFRLEKMIANCCLNGLSAIEKKPFNKLFLNKKTKERIYKIFDESYNILSKEYDLNQQEKMKKRLFENWHKVNHYSSTYQDLFSKRKSEIDFFNGVLVRLGKKYNINAIENKKVLSDFKRL